MIKAGFDTSTHLEHDVVEAGHGALQRLEPQDILRGGGDRLGEVERKLSFRPFSNQVEDQSSDTAFQSAGGGVCVSKRANWRIDGSPAVFVTSKRIEVTFCDSIG